MKNWDTRLVTWAERVRGQPFKWGETDCGSLVKQVYKIIKGKRIGWSAWNGKTGALRWVSKAGGLPEALARVASPVGRGFARSGDVVLVEVHEPDAVYGYGMAVVVGDNVVASHPDHPVTLIPLRDMPNDATYWRF